MKTNIKITITYVEDLAEHEDLDEYETNVGEEVGDRLHDYLHSSPPVQDIDIIVEARREGREQGAWKT